MGELFLSFLLLPHAAQQANLDRAGPNCVRQFHENRLDGLERGGIILSARQDSGQQDVGSNMPRLLRPYRL